MFRKGGEYTLVGVGAFIVIAAMMVATYKYFVPQQCLMINILYLTNFRILKEAAYAVMSSPGSSLVLHLPDDFNLQLEHHGLKVIYGGSCKLRDNTISVKYIKLPFDTYKQNFYGKDICLFNNHGKLSFCKQG